MSQKLCVWVWGFFVPKASFKCCVGQERERSKFASALETEASRSLKVYWKHSGNKPPLFIYFYVYRICIYVFIYAEEIIPIWLPCRLKLEKIEAFHSSWNEKSF